MKNCTLIKKLISGLLVSVMITGLLTGCGEKADPGQSSVSSGAEVSVSSEAPASSETPAQSESSSETPEATGISYPLDTDVTLTVAMVGNKNVTAVYEKYEDVPFYQMLEERTGVKLEFIQCADVKALELLLMSGDLPDMVWGSTKMLPGGAQICVEDEIILPLDDYMDEYMPDYKALLESVYEYKKIASTGDGQIYGAISAGETYQQRQQSGMVIRQDWLDDLGMEVPRTADQFYEMLKAFKEKKGAEVPLSTKLANLKETFLSYGITDAFGLINSGYYQIDGEVHYGYAEPEIKQVFEYMHKLFEEGLLDPEFATLDDAMEKSNILTGRSGCLHLLTGSVNSYRDGQEDPNYCLRGLAPLVQKEGDIARGGTGNGLDNGQVFCITTECENPEIAAAFLNYGYTEEGGLFYCFGTEGETWEYDAQNQPAFTDLIMKNPDGLTYARACATLAHGNYPGPFIQKERYYQQALSVDEDRVKTWERFCETDWEKYVISSGAKVPADLVDEHSKISSEITTFIDQMIVAYITGAKSLDNFETEYMETLKALKVDRLIEINQMTLDAYLGK